MDKGRLTSYPKERDVWSGSSETPKVNAGPPDSLGVALA